MFGNGLNERKEQIARAAVDVFFAKGYKESSLQNISTKGKISKAGIYHYFKSKSDILSYVLLGFTEKWFLTTTATLREAQEKKLSQQQILKVLIATYAKALMSNRKINLIILRERHQLTVKHEKELLERERSVFHMVREQIRKVPNINKKLDASIVAFQIISMIHWMGYWFDSMGPLSEREAIDQMMNIIFTGILDYKK